MAQDTSNSSPSGTSYDSPLPDHDQQESEKSFVTKVRSRVSSTFSKWFGTSAVRQRPDEDDDEEARQTQPPAKRPKLPSPADHSMPGAPSFLGDNNNFLDSRPGPSGIKSRKLFDSSSPMLNGDKDSDSGESTSGYSSMARITKNDPVQTPKQTFNGCLFGDEYPTRRTSRTLFGESCLSPPLNSSLSSRRPSFNASAFGSPTFVDRTLSTKRILNSPFYAGRTTYGGASAYGRPAKDGRGSLRSAAPKIQPVNKASTSGATTASLSQTARRILETLEHYSTPVSEAKQIPHPFRRGTGMLSKHVGASPYSRVELQVPSVPDRLRMKLKSRLQDSTVLVRQIATTSKSPLNAGEYTIKTKEDESSKQPGKIKSKITSVRHKPETDTQTIPEVKLPEVVLPVTALPKFDFSLPAAVPDCSKSVSTTTSSATTAVEMPVFTPVKAATDTTALDKLYTFANPRVISKSSRNITAINDYKFSKPLLKKLAESAKKNKSPPNDDIFEKRFKPALGSWECSVCLIRNLPDRTKCMACEAPKGNDSLVSTEKKPVDNENKLVIIENKLIAEKKQPFPAPKLSNGPALHPNNFGDKFKPAANTWECSVCMIRNKEDVDTCIACTTKREKKMVDNSHLSLPKVCAVACDRTCEEPPPPVPLVTKSEGFADLLKKRVNEWECQTCMIRNPNAKDSCMACETPNPQKSAGVPKPQPPISTFHFGIAQPGTKITVHGFSEDKPSVVPAPTFTFGAKTDESAKETAPSGFGFGIKSRADEKESSNKPATLETSSDKLKPNGGPAFVATPVFSFGVKPAPLVACAEPKSQATTSSQLNPQSPVIGSVTTGLFGASVAKPTSESLLGVATKPEREVKISTPAFEAGSVPFGGAAASSFGSTSDSKEAFSGFRFNAPVSNSTTPTPVSVPPVNFSAPKTEAQPVSNIFGAPSTGLFESAQPGLKPPVPNGGFSFGGGAASAPKAPLFNFGAAAAAGTSGGSTGFNFGAVLQTSAASSGGFNFGPAAPTAFSADAKPTFNFTGGAATTFSASAAPPPPPDAAALAQRRRIRAIRRTQR